MTPEFIEHLERLAAEERTAYLKSLSYRELVDLAVAWANRLDNMASQMSVSILEGLDRRLALDGSSKRAAEELLSRLRAG